MANPEFEELVRKMRQILAAEYSRGYQDATTRIMQAASAPIPANNGHDTKGPGQQRVRAARGSVDNLINRVLGGASDGASAVQIQERAQTPEEKMASLSGIRFALDRGRDAGRYRNEGGKWFLKEGAES